MRVKELVTELQKESDDAYVMIRLEPATYAEVYDLQRSNAKDDSGEYQVVLLCPY